MRVCVNPHQTVATAGSRRSGCCRGARILGSGAAYSSWTGCRRAFRLEQIAKREFSGRRRSTRSCRCFFATAFCFRRGCGRRSRRCSRTRCRASLRFLAGTLPAQATRRFRWLMLPSFQLSFARDVLPATRPGWAIELG
jgi:hypothetical protein